MPEDTKVVPGEIPDTKTDGEIPVVTDVDNKPTVDAVMAQLADAQKALKAANNESAARRKKLQAFEESETKRKEAEMSELEKRDAKIVEMAAQHEELQQSIKDTKLNAAIDVTAVALKFRKVEEARKLINRDALLYGDDGLWTGVDKALEALAKSSPHLIEQAKMPNTDGKKRNTGDPANTDQADSIIKQRYGFQQ